MRIKSLSSLASLVLAFGISASAVSSFADSTFVAEPQENGAQNSDDEDLRLAKELGCPKGPYVNCMPPTTNLFCKATVRMWVSENCPNVSYAD